jgi:hypothetical protein
VFDVIEKPLVSIGVPTCDRALLLERTIKSLIAQDYPNLEIIVSDNASKDKTPEVCARILSQYPFVRYSRNSTRTPIFDNFKRVLLLSTGKYFMWAADDDLWEPKFVSTLVSYLESDQGTVLIAAEAQYMLHDGTKLPFFPEGRAFYDKLPHSKLRRLLTFTSHSYGNLIYGLYRREALFTKNGGTVLDICKFINEIPIFLQIAIRGNVQVCSEVLFYKSAPIATYLQAAREYGFKPVLNQRQVTELGVLGQSAALRTIARTGAGLGTLRDVCEATAFLLRAACRYSSGVFRYHVRALADVRRAIWSTDEGLVTKLVVLMAFTVRFTTHFVKLVVVWQVQDFLGGRMRVSRR